jgi:hypothetical protein
MPNSTPGGGFIIERSGDNGAWTALESLPMQEGLENYEGADQHPFAGYNSYRIKIIGSSSAISYSNVRHVFFGAREELFAIYPNPATDKVNITGGIQKIESIRIVDLSGRIVFNKRGMYNLPVEVNLPRLPAGIYTLLVNDVVSKLVIRPN